MMDMRRVFLGGKFFSDSEKSQEWKNKTDEVPPYCLRTIELRALPYVARMFILFYPPFPSIVLPLML